MTIYTTIVGVTRISVKPGTTKTNGEAIREIVITGPDGEYVLRLVSQHRDDLQVTFAERARRAPGNPEPAEETTSSDEAA